VYQLLFAVIDKKELLGIYSEEKLAQDVISEKRPKAKVVKRYLDLKPV